MKTEKKKQVWISNMPFIFLIIIFFSRDIIACPSASKEIDVANKQIEDLKHVNWESIFRPRAGRMPNDGVILGNHIERFKQLMTFWPASNEKILIVGPRGVGKSVLVKIFEDKMKERGILYVRVDLSITQRTINWHTITEHLVLELEFDLDEGSHALKLKNMPKIKNRDDFISYVKKTYNGKLPVFFIDEMNMANDRQAPITRELLSQDDVPFVGIFPASESHLPKGSVPDQVQNSNDPNILKDIAHRELYKMVKGTHYQFFDIPPTTLQEVKEFVKKKLQSANKSYVKISDQAFRELYYLTSANPKDIGNLLALIPENTIEVSHTEIRKAAKEAFEDSPYILKLLSSLPPS